MSEFYAECCNKYGLTKDEKKLADMREKNAQDLAEIETKTEDAIVNAGDTEVADLMVAKANHFAKIGDFVEANKAYDAVFNKEKVGTNKKIDATMSKCRIALFNMELPTMQVLLTEAKKLNDQGGDWDRRNRLKVYESMYLLAVRGEKKATELLQSCIATFTCSEICDYNDFMFYALLTGVLNLSRVDLKKKVIANPQVITMIKEVPHMQTFVNSFYECEYGTFFRTLLDIGDIVADDRYLGPHTTYILREFRVLAYSQFLEAYRSVTMSTMASSFGMSLELLDQELSHFIAAGRINAKIDKVGDVIETSRPDKKNAQYLDTIKKGDALLNQIQKLIRVVEV
eukprot:GSChrysophyteH1.ASY1.ANO1.1248.1 assembled CDS